MVLKQNRFFFLICFLLSCSQKEKDYIYLFEDSTGERYTWEQLPHLRNKDSFSLTNYYGIRFEEPIEYGDTQVQKFHFYYHRLPHTVDKYVGKRLPKFSLQDIHGDLFSSEMLNGKVAHINFWAPGCTPCVTELVALNRLAEKYKDSVIFVSVTRESTDRLKAFLRTHRFNYVNLVNGGTYFDFLGFEDYPNNFFISRNGNIRFAVGGGPLNSEQAINELYQRYSSYLDTLLIK